MEADVAAAAAAAAARARTKQGQSQAAAAAAAAAERERIRQHKALVQHWQRVDHDFFRPVAPEDVARLEEQVGGCGCGSGTQDLCDG